jgi:DNA-binding IclR family transcriptional regulator
MCNSKDSIASLLFIAATSVAGPAYRIPPEDFAALAGRLVEVTDAISQKLGYLIPSDPN